MITQQFLKMEEVAKKQLQKVFNEQRASIFHFKKQLVQVENGGSSEAFFKDYIQNLDEKICQVNHNQLSQLKKKYRFYLGKVDKLQQIKASLQDHYSSMQDLVENNSIVKEEKESIKFITMISNQTSKKLQQTQSKVNIAKQEKKINSKKIEQLKDLIKKEKDIFFNLKRAQMKIKIDKQGEQKASKLENAQCTFKSIVTNKLSKKNQKKSLKVLQIIPSLSNCNILHLNKQNSSKMSEANEISRLPQITQNNQIISEIMENNLRRQSSQTEWNEIEKERERKAYLSHTAAFENFKSNFEQKKNKKILQINNKSQVGQNMNKKSKKNLVKQLERISILKQEFIKQVERINSVVVTQKRNLNSFEQLQRQKERQCKACVKNFEKFQLSRVKYSLHQQNIKNVLNFSINPTPKNTVCAKTELKKIDIDRTLLTTQQELRKKNQYQKQREQFLRWRAEDIIRAVVQKNKIQQVLRLLEKCKFYKNQIFHVLNHTTERKCEV